MQPKLDPRPLHQQLASCGLELVPHLLEPHRDRIDPHEHLFAVRLIDNPPLAATTINFPVFFDGANSIGDRSFSACKRPNI
jgi:hypothetical protein